MLHLQDIKNTLKSVMWRSAGVKRNAELLAEGLESLAQLKRFMQGEQIESEGWDLQNMLQIGTIIMQAALLREETRGGHTRTEFPERLPEWRKHLTFQRQEDGSVTVETENLK